jgi:hypothetical protein
VGEVYFFRRLVFASAVDFFVSFTTKASLPDSLAGFSLEAEDT